MHAEEDSDDSKREDLEFKVEEFLQQSQFYLNRLPLLKNQLYDINRLNQVDLYIEKLNEIDNIVHDLAENILHIEQLHSHLNENERLKLDHQIYLLRAESAREMSDLDRLREQVDNSFLEENILSINETDNNDIDEQHSIPNELRQRHITTSRLDDPYDLLEQDLAYLRGAIAEVATLVAKQEQQQQQLAISNAQYLKNITQNRIHNTSSFFQKVIYNRYVSVAGGAILGASVGGPVGLMISTKVGALVALSGSAVGAISTTILRQRVSETEELQENNSTAYNQAML